MVNAIGGKRGMVAHTYSGTKGRLLAPRHDPKRMIQRGEFVLQRGLREHFKHKVNPLRVSPTRLLECTKVVRFLYTNFVLNYYNEKKNSHGIL